MLIDYEVYKWLILHKIVPKPDHPHVRADGKVEADDTIKKMIQTGTIFSKIIRILKNQQETATNFPILTPPNLKQLKEMNTPGARVYNWNIVAESLSKFNYTIDKDVKDLIVAGDEDMILATLKDVYKLVMRYNKLKQPDPTDSSINSDVLETVNRKNNDQEYYTKQTQSYRALQNKNGYVNLDHIDIETALGDTGSLMEFLIVSLSQTMSLNSKQSMTLLMHGNKYLAHVLAKGIKGNFEPVIDWYKQLYGNSKHMLQLVVREESTGSVLTILQALKPGLYSKNEDVAQWACRMLSKLAFDFSNLELLPAAWEWFINDNGGLYACMACLKRHIDIAASVTAVLTQFGRYNMLELFTVELKKILIDPLEYVHNVLVMIRPLTDAKFTKEELLSSSIVDYWIEFGMKNSDNFTKGSTPQLRSASLSLLCQIWEIYPQKVESQEGLANQILTMVKRSIRDHFKALRITALTYLFRILESFASERNPYAPIVYKILTFTLIEHHEDLPTREFILDNFISIIRSSQSIPIGIILEPLTKQIQNSEGKTYILNLTDFKFLDSAANHPKLSLKNGIQLLDLLAKIYLTNVTFAHLASAPMITIISRFIEEDAMQEYLIEFGKLCLSKYYTSVKKKKNKESIAKKFIYLEDKDELYSGPTQITPEMEEEILNAQRRALIINMIKDIILLQSSILNAKYKTLLVYTNSQLKQYIHYDNKGIKYLLSLLGDPDEIIRDYEQEKEPIPNSMMDFKGDFSKYDDPNQPNEPQGPIRNPLLEKAERAAQHAREINNRSPPKDKGNPSDYYASDFLRTRQDDEVRFDDAATVYSDNRANTTVKKSPEKRKDQLSPASLEARLRRKKKTIDPETKANQTVAFMKALDEIEQIKAKKNQKRQEKDLIDELKKMKEEKTKGALRQQLEKRRIELGVETKINSNIPRPALLEEDIGAKSTKSKDLMKENLIVDLDEDEFFQKESVTVFNKNHIKKYKYLFNKYANTAASYQKTKDFDKLKVQFSVINPAELQKLVKDNSMGSFINKDEIIALMRQVNARILRKGEMDPLNFEGFVKYIAQLAIYIFSKPPLSQVNYNYVDCLEKFFSMVFITAKEKGEHRLMLDDKDTYPNTEDLARLNIEIQDNPNMRLPEGYKKILESSMDYVYRVPGNGVNPAVKLAYEVLDDMINQQFGFHIMEKKMVFNSFFKVVPQQKVEIQVPKSTKMRDDKSPVDQRGRTQANMSRSNEPRQQQEYNTYTSQEKYKTKFINKVVEDKIRKEEEEKAKEAEAEKRRQQRKKELDEQLRGQSEQARQLKLQKEEEERKAQLDKIEKEKERELSRRRELEKKKELVKQYREKRQQEVLIKEEEEKDNKLKEFQNMRKDREDFIKKQKLSLHEQFEEKKRKRDEEAKQKEQRDEEDKQKEEKKKRSLSVQFEKERQKREKEKENNIKIIGMVHDPVFAQCFGNHAKQLANLFKFYKEDQASDFLTFRGFMNFAAQFNVFPSLVSAQGINLIFKTVTKEKQKSSNVLSYDDFQQALLRIAIKSQDVLNKIYSAFKDRHYDDGMGAQEHIDMQNMINEVKQQQGLDQLSPAQMQQMKQNANYDKNTVHKDAIDEYEKVDQMTPDSLEGLFTFLDLPNNPRALSDKLKFLKEQNQRMAPRDKKMVAMNMLNKGNGSFSPSRDNTNTLHDISTEKFSPRDFQSNKGLPPSGNIGTQSKQSGISNPGNMANGAGNVGGKPSLTQSANNNAGQNPPTTSKSGKK